jgi:Transposase DDE domain
LWDRNFLSYAHVAQVQQRQAHLLARIKKHVVSQPLRRLADGSYLAKLYRASWYREHDRDGILVRVMEYTFKDRNRPGAGEKHRLLTTLLQPALDPAKRLIELYHQRWELELAIDELKTHQRERPVLRSETPAGVVQEIYGLLLAHYVVRVLMFEAARPDGIDPRRLSFTGTLKILRCRLPQCPKSAKGLAKWYNQLLAEIATERLPARANRTNPRVIKRKMSSWPKKRPKHGDYPQPKTKFRQSIVMLN